MKRITGTCAEARGTASARSPMLLKIGVMGGATGRIQRHHLDKAHQLGRTIAQNGSVLITGACPGLPLAAAAGSSPVSGTMQHKGVRQSDVNPSYAKSGCLTMPQVILCQRFRYDRIAFSAPGFFPALPPGQKFTIISQPLLMFGSITAPAGQLRDFLAMVWEPE
jgi:hypothetical protein